MKRSEMQSAAPLCWPSGQFGVIIADPPWSYERSGVQGAAALHYPTMTDEDIYNLPVADIARADAVLLLWATWPKLTEAMRVVTAWGFEYVTGIAEAHGRAVARTVQPLVGHSESGAE